MLNKNYFKNKNFSGMLKKYDYNLHPGDIVAGTIFHQENKGFLVNIGDNTAGYLPIEEIHLSFNHIKDIKFLVKTTREFFIIAYNAKIKQLILSIKRLEYIRAWKRIKQIYKENIILNLNIENTNKGGIVTYIEGLQGFIPNSHITINNSRLNNYYIKCKFLIADEKKNQIILSNKSASLYLSSHKFRVAEIIYGKVIEIKQYGIFIKINNILALLHISEIGSKYIPNLTQTFLKGEIIKVKIIHIDFKQGRISLSKKNIH